MLVEEHADTAGMNHVIQRALWQMSEVTSIWRLKFLGISSVGDRRSDINTKTSPGNKALNLSGR